MKKINIFCGNKYFVDQKILIWQTMFKQKYPDNSSINKINYQFYDEKIEKDIIFENNSNSFFDDKKLIILNLANETKVLDILNKIKYDENNIIIIKIEGEIKKNKNLNCDQFNIIKIYIDKYGKLINFRKIDDVMNLYDFFYMKYKSEFISKELFDKIIRLMNLDFKSDNLYLLSNELEKIVLYSKYYDIDIEIIKKLIDINYTEDQIFDLILHITQKNAKKIYKSLQDLIQDSYHLPMFISSFMGLLIKIIIIKDMNEKIKDMNELCKNLGYNIYFIKNTLSNFKNYSVSSLQILYNKMCNFERDIKTGIKSFKKGDEEIFYLSLLKILC